MVEECSHIRANGQKCRRLPKRGQKYCAAHHPSRRRPRRAFEEDQAFHNAMFAFVDRLRAMTLEDLLYAVCDAINDLHFVVDRHCSRRHRAFFHRASTALTITAERITEDRLAQTRRAPVPPRPPATPATPPFSLTPEQRAGAQSALEALTASPNLSPEQLIEICDRMLSTLEPNQSTTSTLSSNR